MTPCTDFVGESEEIVVCLEKKLDQKLANSAKSVGIHDDLPKTPQSRLKSNPSVI